MKISTLGNYYRAKVLTQLQFQTAKYDAYWPNNSCAIKVSIYRLMTRPQKMSYAIWSVNFTLAHILHTTGVAINSHKMKTYPSTKIEVSLTWYSWYSASVIQIQHSYHHLNNRCSTHAFWFLNVRKSLRVVYSITPTLTQITFSTPVFQNKPYRIIS